MQEPTKWEPKYKKKKKNYNMSTYSFFVSEII